MKKTAKIALREKSEKDLQKHVESLKSQLLETKVKHHMGQQKDTSFFKKVKSELAFVLTLLANKK